tara:strand:- start:194 stop:373 length:180 start_codon:yes stop_codon:yes gene_type:complete
MFRVGATFLTAAEVANALVVVRFVEDGIAAGSEQLEEGEWGVGDAMAVAGGGWACHHLK